MMMVGGNQNTKSPNEKIYAISNNLNHHFSGGPFEEAK
jgi:hypothetical protein